MKKIITIALSFLILSSIFASGDYDRNISFSMSLNKVGRDEIYFSDSNINGANLKDNRYIFPLIDGEDKTSLSSAVYFYCLHQTDQNINVSLLFSANDLDLQGESYMLVGQSSKDIHLNYNVSVTNTATNEKIGEIVAKPLEKMSNSDRTISFFLSAESASSTPVVSKIDMEVVAPRYEDGNQKFMDAQYAGYIIATVEYL